jgi:UDP-N-acetyl-D-mannosaminuronate dehydrogenase
MAEVYRPLYLNAAPLLHVSRRTAELIKYAANAFLATKITFINEIADLCERTGADVNDVARGMGLDNRIGGKFLHAGPGFGGSCFPKDATALLKTAHDHGVPLRIVETVAAVNDQRKRAMARKVVTALDGSIRGKTVAVLGLSFKPNTDDMRDSPSIPLITALHDLGAVVRGYDPAAMEAAKAQLPDVIYCGNAYEAAEGAEAVVIATEWEQFRATRSRPVARGHGAAGDRRSAQHLPRRGNEAGEFPLSRRRPAECGTATGKPAAAPPQGCRHKRQTSRRQRPRARGLGENQNPSDFDRLFLFPLVPAKAGTRSIAAAPGFPPARE